MKHRRFASLLTAAAYATAVFVLSSEASSGQSAQGDAKDKDAAVRELKEKVVKLEARVAELQKQIDEIRKKPAYPYFAIPEPNPRPKKPVPQDWKPFQFNGQQYYIVPLTENPSNPGAQNIPLHKTK
jgi:hypothetical protein